MVRGSSPREAKVTSRKMQTHDTTWLELEPSCRSIVEITLTVSNSRPPVKRVSERTGASYVIPGKWARPGRSTMLIRYYRQNKVSWLTLALLSRLVNLTGCQSDGKIYYLTSIFGSADMNRNGTVIAIYSWVGPVTGSREGSDRAEEQFGSRNALPGAYVIISMPLESTAETHCTFKLLLNSQQIPLST